MGVLVILGHDEAIRRIERELPLKVVSNRIIYDDRKMFSELNLTFSDDEKGKLRRYCEIADPVDPEGYGRTQSNVAFYYRVPDNTIPILRTKHSGWKNRVK